ncbi:MAG: AAA family ATPase [Proteobacteria bacterium]|nr:AAA family ATPase [Pseudomonadota bacterium]
MPVSATDPVQLIAFLEDPIDIEVVQEALEADNIGSSEVRQGGVKEAIETFSSNRSPQFLIIDISNSDLPVSDLSRLSEVCEPGITVLAVGNRNEVGLYRDLIKLGIHEYLVKPLLPEILGRALKSLILGEDKDKTPQTKQGKIIITTGTRGGVGSTFLATNFSAILAGENARRIIVVDLDIYFGTVSLYYNVKSNDGLKVALESPERIDQLFLERLFTSINERLYVLSSEGPLETIEKYNVASIEQLLKYLSKIFHYVIVDIPHGFTEVTQAVIDQADMMLLVTDSTLAGLRDAGRIIHFFGAERLGRRLILIMNKYGGEQKGMLSPENFEETLKYKISHVIPFDPTLTPHFTNQGLTLVNQANAVANTLRDIVNDVQGTLKRQKKTSFIDTFFNKIKFN